MERPQRIQRKRTAGWRMPANTVSVTRPGPFGNPFKVGAHFRKLAGNYFVFNNGDRPFGGREVTSLAQSLELFDRYAREKAKREPNWLAPLRGKNLACWCKTSGPCHADLLLELANQ